MEFSSSFWLAGWELTNDEDSGAEVTLGGLKPTEYRERERDK
jgi:hypothetical protein